MAAMAQNTRRTLLEQHDQDQANHWIGIPKTRSIVDSINEPTGPHSPTGSIVDAHTAPMTNPPALTLNIPEPEPPQPISWLDEQLASGNVTAVTTFPSKVTHLLLPALLTEWHRVNAEILRQPEYEDLLKAWEIMVQKVDNTSKGYNNS